MDISFPAPQSDRERIARLRLYRTRNIGPVTFRRLLQRFGDAQTAIDALPELAQRGGVRNFRPYSLGKAEQEIADLDRIGGAMLHLGDLAYPHPLTLAEDAPPVLMTLGNPLLLKRPAIAIVGARNASANGRAIAASFATDLSDAGYIIVSGMARGIDAAAHSGALDGATIAVVAGGVDVIYPRENTALYHQIASDGLIVSEMPTGRQPQGRHFPRRNRIISGLSVAVVVIEAAERSGSLTTARFANEQGREVLAVPGSPLDPRTHGTSRLIREGATLVVSSTHIFEALEQPYQRAFGSLAHIPEERIDGGESTPETPPIHGPIAELISPSPTPIDEIVRLSGHPSSAVRAVLLDLEIAGQIQCLPGNFVVQVSR